MTIKSVTSALARPVMLIVLAVALWSGAGQFAAAQDAKPGLDAIDRQLVALDSADNLPMDDVERAREALEQAKGRLRAADERAAMLRTYTQQAANSDDIRQQLESETSEVERMAGEFELPETRQEFRSQLSFLKAERGLMINERDDLVDRESELANRAGSIATEISDARNSLARFTELAAQEDTDQHTLLAEAARTLRAAQIFERQSAISDLAAELETLAPREPIMVAQLELASAKINALDVQISAIQQRLSDTRTDRADDALAAARQTQSDLSDVSSAVQELAGENVALALALQDMATSALDIEQDIALHEGLRSQINRQLETVEKVMETGRITDEVGVLLRQVRTGLPNVQMLREQTLKAEERRVATQLNLILWQDRLRSLNSSDVPAHLLLGQFAAANGTPQRYRSQDLEAAQDLAADQTRLLKDMIVAGQAQSDRLTNQEIGIRETLNISQTLRNTLDRRLLWLPSNARPIRSWTGNVKSSLDWLSAASNYRKSFEEFKQAALRAPTLFIIMLIIAAGLVVDRRRMKQVLCELGERVGKVARDKYWTTPFAVLTAALIALPGPLVVGMLGAIPLYSGVIHPLTRAIAAGLIAAALIMFLMRLLAVMRAEGGVLMTHFGWSDKAIAVLGKHSKWFFPFQCVAAFVLAAAMTSGRADVQHGIGMLAFLAASIGLAVFGYHVFKPDNGLASLILSKAPHPFLILLSMLGFVVAPFIIGALPLLGYYDTAIALQSRVLLSVGAMIAFPIIYGVLRRQLLIAQRRLALRRAIERRAQKEAERAEQEEADDGRDVPSATPEELANERQRISVQTRRVLLYLTGLAALIALTTIWAAMLPALGIASEIILWTGTDTVEGVETLRPVSLWNLTLFFGFIAAGFVAAANIRGILEIGLFQRLKLNPGTRYAINTILGYILVGTGLVLGFLQLGIDWGKLQWIIAALGVGLGFGLQEIVANFISGLIILFERPIRVGDMVTIGELEGTVSNIAIRATTITDFDNREVLLPNKAIITENVINWTLRDSVMRIILTIGVAYGSNIEQVRDLLMDVATSNDDVMETPNPRVFFMNHGDSSLDFEMRVYLSNPRKRYRVRHELNTAINTALKDAGIAIPFPQRDVHVHQN